MTVEGEIGVARSWSPTPEQDEVIPLGWPSRQAFIDWLEDYVSKACSEARADERARQERERTHWMGAHAHYVVAADALLSELRFALAKALRDRGM